MAAIEFAFSPFGFFETDCLLWAMWLPWVPMGL